MCRLPSLFATTHRCSQRAPARLATSPSTPAAARTPSCRRRNRKPIPTVKVAPAKGWSGDQKPSAAAGLRRVELRSRSRSSALALRAAERRRARCGNQRAGASRGQERDQGLLHEQGAEEGRRRHAERESHHLAARRRRRRQGRIPQRVPEGPQFAVRHGAGRQRLLRREHRRGHALQVPRRLPRSSTAPARRSPTCRRGRSIITGPRT